MTLTEAGIITGIVVAAVGGSGFVGKLVGDTIWLPISTYQQEKLYDLEDEAEEYRDREELDGALPELEQRKLKRLLKSIERLEDELE